MDTLEKGKNKLSEICDILRKETLEPAQDEANEIIEKAQQESQKIIEKAHIDAESLLEEARAKIEQEKKLFESSMSLATKQTFDHLKEKIQIQLFNDQLDQLTKTIMSKSDLVAKLIAAIINIVEKEGLGSNLAVSLAKAVKAEEVCQYLVASAAEKVKSGAIVIEASDGGAKIVLLDQKMSVDISSDSLKDMLGSFLRDSFRDVLFKNV